MKQWIFLLIMFLLTLLGLALFGGFVFNFDPLEMGAAIKILVYLTLFFGLTGLFSLVCSAGRKILKRKNNAEMDFWAGVVASIIIVVGMIVLSKF